MYDGLIIPQTVSNIEMNLHGLYVLLILVGLMWLAESRVKEFLLSKGEDIAKFGIFIYRLSGIGFLFIIGYSLYLL
jgi:hypothetical protein